MCAFHDAFNAIKQVGAAKSLCKAISKFHFYLWLFLVFPSEEYIDRYIDKYPI